jgi:hypothetical protein
MTKKWIISLVLVLLASAGAWLWWNTQQGWTVARLERLIGAEVPVGSDLAQVEGWLNCHGIQNTYSILNAHDNDYADSARQAGLRKQNLSGVMKGDVVPANESWFFRSEIEVLFFFDKNGRLAGHTVDVWFDFL